MSSVLAEMLPINLESITVALLGIERKILSLRTISIFYPRLSTFHTMPKGISIYAGPPRKVPSATSHAPG
jgi:hypothetical protein